MAAVIKIEIISSSADRGLKDTEKSLRDIDRAAKDTKGGFDTLKGVGVAALGAVALAAGAFALAASWRDFPEGTIFLAVVDPGVGTARRALALQADGRLFVGPDNGILSLVIEDAEGEVVVREITNAI